MYARTTAVSALALAVALSVTGCSTPAPTMPGMGNSSTTSTANSADQMFVMMMIPHHEQAIEMADMVLAADGISPEVVALATRIKAAQQPEIDTMSSWLDAWGVPDMMSDMDHGTGMMSDDDLAELDTAVGPELERLFLTQMIEHHRGAIEMAQDEIEDGRDPAVIDLARSIVASQTAEIDEMTALLSAR